MKVLFISPEQGISSKNATPVPPSALLYIAGLTPKDIEIELVDLSYDDIDFDSKPDLVALSVMTIMAMVSYQVADRFREKGVKVVLGGHHPTAMPIEAKQHADIVVIGEAEYLWERLLDDVKNGVHSDFYVGGNTGTLLLNDLPGKVYKDDRIPDLTNLPPMRRDLLRKKYLFDVIFTTRGCPYNCSFCSVTKLFGKTQRHRPIPEVINEMHQIRNLFFMTDDNCYFPYNYYSQLYSAMYNEFKGSKKWYSQGSLSIVKQPNGDILLEKAARAGQIAVFIGLESVNPKSLLATNSYVKLGNSSKSNINIESSRKAILRIQSFGIQVWAFIILGFQEDTSETFKETLAFLDDTKVLPLPIALCPLPGTDLWEEYKDKLLPNITWNKWDGGHALFNHPTLDTESFENEVNQLRVDLFSWKRIIRRLTSNKLSSIPMNFFVELGMRKSFVDVFKQVKKDRLSVTTNDN